MISLIIHTIIIILAALFFYRLGVSDTRKDAIKRRAAVWAINHETGRKQFEFLQNRNNEAIQAFIDIESGISNVKGVKDYWSNWYKTPLN